MVRIAVVALVGICIAGGLFSIGIVGSRKIKCGVVR